MRAISGHEGTTYLRATAADHAALHVTDTELFTAGIRRWIRRYDIQRFDLQKDIWTAQMNAVALTEL